MKNLNISVRLSLGFGAVLALLIIVSTVSILRMQSSSRMTDDLVRDQVRNERLIDEWQQVVEVNAARTTGAYLAVDPADQAVVEGQMKKSSARATEIQTKLGEVLDQPAEKARLAEVLSTRASYTAARARVFKEKAAGNADVAKQIYSAEMVTKREAYLAALAKMALAQRQEVDNTAAAIRAQYESARTMMISLSALAVLLGVVFAVSITRAITVPLREAVRVAQTVSSGDLTSVITVDTSNETGQLMGALKAMNDSLVKIVGEVRAGTDTIGTASTEIADGNMDLSSRTEQQASALEETASSMEELTSTVKFNADNARQANMLAITASEVAARGGNEVSEVVATMGSINDSSRKIVDIISVIDGIAFQTNILALNAAVEAARAGEQGRGFAVVASEVRNLAQRSAAAAKEIKTLIGDSVEKVDAGSRLVDRAGKTMSEVVTSITRVTDIMNEITTASDEQREGIEQVNMAITQMDSVTQQNAALVEEAAAAAASMQEQAARLTDVVGVFKLDTQAAPRRAAATPARPLANTATPARPARRLAKPAGQAPASATQDTAPARQKVAAAAKDDWEEF
jgi:methyl-accepting chemotaxis protein